MDHAANQVDNCQKFTCMHCLAEYDDPVVFFGHLQEEHFVHGGDQSHDLSTIDTKQDCENDSGKFLDYDKMCAYVFLLLLVTVIKSFNFKLQLSNNDDRRSSGYRRYFDNQTPRKQSTCPKKTATIFRKLR